MVLPTVTGACLPTVTRQELPGTVTYSNSWPSARAHPTVPLVSGGVGASAVRSGWPGSLADCWRIRLHAARCQPQPVAISVAATALSVHVQMSRICDQSGVISF